MWLTRSARSTKMRKTAICRRWLVAATLVCSVTSLAFAQEGNSSNATGEITRLNAVSDRSNLTVQVVTAQPYHFRNTQVLIDQDSNASTGYRTGGAGVDYMIEGSRVFRFVGESPRQWNWQLLGTAVRFTDENVLTLIIQGDMLLTGNVELYARTLTDDSRKMVSRWPKRELLAVEIEEGESQTSLVSPAAEKARERERAQAQRAAREQANAEQQTQTTSAETQAAASRMGVEVESEFTVAGAEDPSDSEASAKSQEADPAERSGDVRDNTRDVVMCQVTREDDSLVIMLQMRGPARFEDVAVFIDADRDSTTGYHFAAGDGFEYAVYGDTLQFYQTLEDSTAEGQWRRVGTVVREHSVTRLVFRLPLNALPGEQVGVAVFTAQGRQVLDRAPDVGLYSVESE